MSEARATLAIIARDLGMSVRKLLAFVDGLYHEGHVELAYQSTPEGKVYPVEAVRQAVIASKLADVEVSPEVVPIVEAAQRKVAAYEARKAHRAQKKIEGTSRKANRRAAKERRATP